MTTIDADVERVFGLTPLQEGLLVESLAAPGASLYLEQVVVELHGALSMPAMAKAWRAVVARHAVLRTSFHWRDLERPLQVVHRRVVVPISHNDLGRLPPERRAAAARRFLELDRTRGFAFDRAPLLRVAVLRHGASGHRLVVTLHHILLDGWSLGIVMDDVGRLYKGFAEDAPARLDEPPEFGDYVAWVGEQDPAAAERYWRRQLGDHEGAPPVARRFGGHGRAHDHRELELALTPAESAAARERARAERVTLNTVVLGAWALVLGAELGTDDIVVGTVVSGREAPVAGMESMVGLCINTVPVRICVASDLPAGAWLAELHVRQLEQREYQHCALTAVHGWSGTPRGRPLFESIFIFENHASGRTRARAFERTSYPLTVIVGVTGELTVRMLYDASVIEREAVRRLARRLRSVLAGLARDAGRPLRQVARLTGEEREAVRAAGRGRRVELSARWAHELVGDADRRAVALVEGDRRVTFGELVDAADALARRLHDRGAGPGRVVAIDIERSANAVIALLGVLKAGAAYLPLDADLPEARRRFMLGDCGASVVLSAADVEVDAAASAVAVPRVAGGDLAWVLYTSGSSGRPKGVAGTHVGLANRIAWGERAQPFTARDVACAKSRLGFVDSVCELLAPLCAGRPVVIADEQTANDPLALAELLARERVTRLVAVPSLLRVMTELAADTLRRSALRLINASGEPLTAADVRALRRVLPACELWNIYGSTEVAADATAHRVDQPDSERIPIGRPLDNVTIELCDPTGELVPLGASGEIVVGGLGVSPGYIGHAQTEQDRFTPDRRYRTGDLGRWRPDGTLEHHGRADRQLKIRGARVEPDELEHTLKTHPAIDQAAATAHQTPDGPTLAAYYTTNQPINPDQLRAHLQTRLPTQLIPTHLTELPQLPQLPNGKLDRTTIAELEPAAPRGGATPPRSAAEEAVAQTFSELLGVPRVGAFDDFFALGGHSLLATRLVSALNARFGIELPLGRVFEHPVVADLADAIERLLLAQIRAEEEAARA